MVQLFKNGESRKDIIHKYTLTPSALDKWIKDYDKTRHLSIRIISEKMKKMLEINEIS
ncbi:hypothetical protein BU010_13370 [Mammaliicoccus sciuri]|nr:hypothetical protein BU010_13370 [Mammaliicoccus sciuri]